MEKALDNRDIAGGVLTDLSKAFECVNHDLLIAKLDAYGFDKNALKFIHSYLSDRKHRTKINNSFSNWAEIRSGVPQGSILGPLLFNIYINDIFLFLPKTKIANYADDNTPYEIENSIRDVISKLENDMRLLSTWFNNNYMASNDDKCKLIITNEENSFVNIGKERITCSQSVKLLGVMIDNKLKV